MKHLFYAVESQDHAWSHVVADDLVCRIWTPSLFSFKPKGVPWLPFGVWWAAHYLKVFANRDYSLYVVYDGERLVHRSCVFPGYFRFPFMNRTDLQIGDTFTAPEYRGRGIATRAIQEILSAFKERAGRIWYVVEEDNAPSIRAVEKAGFQLIGEGVRTKRFGLRVFGSYVLESDASQLSHRDRTTV
jgi:RimJ/RimL family protein N-acetyltransferase